jgi:hypothetical protein
MGQEWVAITVGLVSLKLSMHLLVAPKRTEKLHFHCLSLE